MKKLTIAATITAIAIGVSAPFTFAQTTPEPNTAPPAASPRGNEMGPGMMYNQDQGQGQVQGQGQSQVPGYGPGMMGSYGSGWMGGYGGMWVVILLILAAVGLAAWVVTHKRK